MLIDPRHTMSSPVPEDAERTPSAILRDVLRSTVELRSPQRERAEPPPRAGAFTADQARR